MSWRSQVINESSYRMIFAWLLLPTVANAYLSKNLSELATTIYGTEMENFIIFPTDGVGGDDDYSMHFSNMWILKILQTKQLWRSHS